MGVAGGLVPGPSALVVLLGAVALGRTWFGVLLRPGTTDDPVPADRALGRQGWREALHRVPLSLDQSGRS